MPVKCCARDESGKTGCRKKLWEAKDERHVWQRRFYDFVVWTKRKRVEKLRYMHNNPVERGLVLEPQQWNRSSYHAYAHGERRPVLVNEQQPVELKPSGRATEVADRAMSLK